MRYYNEVSHPGLNKHRVISDTDQGVLAIKVRQQIETWDEEWERKCEIEREKEELRRVKEEEKVEREAAKRQAECERLAKQRKKEGEREKREAEKRKAEREKEKQQRRREEALLSGKDQAAKRTARAQAALDDLQQVLTHAIKEDHPLDWEALLDKAPFPERKPLKPDEPPAPSDAACDMPEPPRPVLARPQPLTTPPKPQLRLPPKPELVKPKPAPRMQKPAELRLPPRPEMHPPVLTPPVIGLIDKLVPGLAAAKREQAEVAYLERVAKAKAQHARNVRNWELYCAPAIEKHQQLCGKYNSQMNRADTEAKQAEVENARRVRGWEQSCADARARHQQQCEAHDQRCAEARRAWELAIREYEEELAKAELEWNAALQSHREAVEVENARREAAHRNKLADYEARYLDALSEWEQSRDCFFEKQKEANDDVFAWKGAYEASERTAVISYFEAVLTRRQYPFSSARHVTVDYTEETRILIVDFALPQLGDLPTLKEVKFIQSRQEFTESHLSDRDRARHYDQVLYQIALGTTFGVYSADVADAVASVVFNGWSTSIDKATGKQVTACIMSLQTVRETFLDINLPEVDPKECFRRLKGIASPQLHSLTPVAPVLSIDRDDARFVASYDVTGALDDSFNLAAMDWEDFEHLIRELFEQEFSQAGGEVRVTQASRDGGVDAIVFDPDPIRGGKIVIQAKRYTNIVSVSAVRDLYGTVVNEGATKGILVCTSDYGPDAHAFAQGKPLTLLNGNNLLSLLERHGHKAKIDIAEARQIMANNERQESQVPFSSP